MLASYMMHHERFFSPEMKMTFFAIKIFLLIWIVFVPVAITSRLEKIIKLLEDKKKSE